MSIVGDIFTMNKAFGFEFGNATNEELKNSIYNVSDEVEEGVDALDEDDLVGFLDALGDAMVFTIGGFFKAGVSEEKIERIMRTIFESNMSKFCESDKNLEQTIKKYNYLGIDVVPVGEGKYRHVRTSPGDSQTDINGKVYQANKFLKGVNFFTPEKSIKTIIMEEN